jgi:drug/metabolite transporter (DMT)-like permease
MGCSNDQKKRWKAEFLLLVTTFFWGVTFVVVKEAIQITGVFVFLAQRFTSAALIMAGICLVMRRPFASRLIGQGMVMGFFLFGGYAFQTVALLYTTASNTAFLTGLSIVLVPLLGVIFHGHRVTRNMIAGVILAAAGLYLLCTNGGWFFNRGDLLAGVCAVSVALHMIYTGKYAAGGDVYWLTAIQLGVVALLSVLMTLLLGDRLMVWHPEILWALVICVLFATVFAFLVQTAAQRLTDPTHTALIFCMEPVFAALFAYVMLGERFGVAGAVGAFLILAGMILAEIGNRGAAARNAG